MASCGLCHGLPDHPRPFADEERDLDLEREFELEACVSVRCSMRVRT